MTVGSVAVALVDDMPLYEIAIATEVFGPSRADLADPWYELRVCASASASVHTEAGFVMPTPYGFDELVRAETVIVPALPHSCLHSDNPVPSDLIVALRSAAAAGARMVSLCSGAFALAAAGLLDGRRATTHWLQADTLAGRYPEVEVDATVLYVDDGDVLTSAGRSAGLDLCLHLVRCDLGAHVANQLARRLVASPHRTGGQAQFIDTSVSQAADDDMASVLSWIQHHLDAELSVDRLAQQAKMSTRTFVRRFHAATGTTPGQWLLGQRINRARDLLESTGLSVDQVGRRSGLGSAANLRKHFQANLGVSPTEYRRSFTG
ncbi:helix-turn-helix domain-containing protein [Nocardia brevicatena]|uniref:helix-turn-helix domain-containing protein n=1 Tax=Nocardia brevicatena TaxID=37327 RepID=UPI000592EAEF|nr:helix-turn-helix domain-containing protein [Nocardia brevicatena]